MSRGEINEDGLTESREIKISPKIVVFLEWLKGLIQRPRRGEKPRRESDRRTQRAGHPIVCLIGADAHANLMEAIADFLAQAQGEQVPYALFRHEEAAPPQGDAPPQGAGSSRDEKASQRGKASQQEKVTSDRKGDAAVGDDLDKRPLGSATLEDVIKVHAFLIKIAKSLWVKEGDRRVQIKFLRFALVQWLFFQELSNGDIRDQVLQRRMREREMHLHPLADSLDDFEKIEGKPWWLGAFIRAVRYGWSGLKIRGLIPGVGQEYVWLVRQKNLASRNPGTIIGFAERLTGVIAVRDGVNVPGTSKEDPGELLKILVNAFLEDLRSAYRRRPWRLAGSARTAYPVILLDGITRDNGGYRLLATINDIRNETGAFDPLLVISRSRKAPPFACTSDSITDVQDAYRVWRGRISKLARSRSNSAWFLTLQVPPQFNEGEHENAVLDVRSIEPPTIRKQPWWTKRGLLPAIAGFLIAALMGASYLWYNSWSDAHCGLSWFAADVSTLMTIEDECIGVAGENLLRFAEVNSELTAPLERIREQNRMVERMRRENPERPYITVAYLSDLSVGSGKPGFVAERENLAGVAAAQYRQLIAAETTPLVRILVANAGAGMRHGPRVAEILERIARDEESHLIGVAGLDQSHQATINTIRALGHAGLPMVAATLSADSLTNYSDMYFQIAPQNRRQAAVAARYALHVLLPAGEIERRVLIVYSADETDSYSNNLRSDVGISFGEAGFDVADMPYVPVAMEGIPPVGAFAPGEVGSEICGYPGLVFFTGRPEDFNEMLRGLNDTCPRDQYPRILGGDDISRYVADRRSDAPYSHIRFDYLSFAVSACEIPGALEQALREIFPGDSCTDRTLDGHAAMAYDSCTSLSEPPDI